MSDGNLALWEGVCKTPPSHTKEVRLGARRFTTIDAYWQIREATRVFGPVGRGWGWEVAYEYFTMGEGETAQILVLAIVTLWHGSREQTVSAVGAKALFSKGRFDDDAHKKALTDAITKGLSYIGFNADVFLGKFDDSKYVQQMREEEARGSGNGNGGSTNDGPGNGSGNGNYGQVSAVRQRVAVLARSMGLDPVAVTEAIFDAYGVTKLQDLDPAKADEFAAGLQARADVHAKIQRLLGSQPATPTLQGWLAKRGEPTNLLCVPLTQWQAWLEELTEASEADAEMTR